MAELIHTFNSGKMNKDLDERLVPNGEYRDALNLELASSDSSNVGSFQNVKGNLELRNKRYNPKTGIYSQWLNTEYITALNSPVCIGAKTDENSNDVYWFIASNTISVIAHYNSKTKLTRPLIVDTQGILNFSSNYLITGVNVLEGMLIGGPLEILFGIKAFKKAKNVVFVGTRPQIAPVIKNIAEECNAHYVNTRWVGGLLTNWSTISACIQNLNDLDKLLEQDPKTTGLTKKELVQKEKEMERKDKFFGGVRQLSSLPDLVVIVGQPHERNAVLECQKLNIPTITLLDSNCDPSYTTYGIPANDDSTRSVEFILKQLVS